MDNELTAEAIQNIFTSIHAPEPSLSNKEMVSELYEEIMRAQAAETQKRMEVAEAVTAGNASRVAMANTQWYGTRAKLTGFYSLWSRFTGEEFMS